jgi:hypothetical protein
MRNQPSRPAFGGVSASSVTSMAVSGMFDPIGLPTHTAHYT